MNQLWQLPWVRGDGHFINTAITRRRQREKRRTFVTGIRDRNPGAKQIRKRAAPGAANTERALTKISLLEATLAAPNFNSGERLHIYRLLFLLNRSFHLIVERLEELDKTGIFRSRDLAEMRGLTQEVQLEINTGVLNSLKSVENNDWAHFGKIRTAMEKRLRGTK